MAILAKHRGYNPVPTPARRFLPSPVAGPMRLQLLSG